MKKYAVKDETGKILTMIPVDGVPAEIEGYEIIGEVPSDLKNEKDLKATEVPEVTEKWTRDGFPDLVEEPIIEQDTWVKDGEEDVTAQPVLGSDCWIHNDTNEIVTVDPNDETNYMFFEAGANDPTWIRLIVGHVDPRYTHVPYQARYHVIEKDESAANARTIRETMKAKAHRGKLKKDLADQILTIIAGHNDEKGLTTGQINSMKSTFKDIFDGLQSGMPYAVKPLIEAIEPDGTITTQDELDHVMAAYDIFAEQYPEFAS